MTDTEFREHIQDVLKETYRQIEENSKRITLKDLNWNKNPAIKQACECLGIFENPPKIDGPLHLDTLDFDLELEEMLENLGLLKKPKAPSIEELNEFLKSKLESNSINTRKILIDTVSNDDKLKIS